MYLTFFIIIIQKYYSFYDLVNLIDFWFGRKY
jgi:hypothetical protein